MKEAAEWRLLDGGGVQVVDDADRAGRSMITVNVDDIEALVTEMTARGIEAKPTAPDQGPLRLARITRSGWKQSDVFGGSTLTADRCAR